MSLRGLMTGAGVGEGIRGILKMREAEKLMALRERQQAAEEQRNSILDQERRDNAAFNRGLQVENLGLRQQAQSDAQDRNFLDQFTESSVPGDKVTDPATLSNVMRLRPNLVRLAPAEQRVSPLANEEVPEPEYQGTAAQRLAETRRSEDIEAKKSMQEDAQQNRADMLRLAASLRTDSARQRIIAVPAMNEKGESVTQGTDLETGQVLWEKPRDITASQKDRKASIGRVAPVLTGIAELSERINTGKGVVAKIAGGVERAKAQANLNDDVAEYNALISGFTPMIARAVGHTGVLTQQDVDSVRAMFPQPGDSKSLRDRKIARISGLIGGESGQAMPDSGQPESIIEWVRDPKTGKLVQKGK